MSNKTYTYRAGKKVELNKSLDQMITRTLPENLADSSILEMEQVSSASTRVKTSEAKLEEVMAETRNLAPTHHAYYDKKTGQEFLITDRVFISFKQDVEEGALNEFINTYGLIIKDKYDDKNFLFQLTDHTGKNPVKLVVELMENEPLVELAEHDLNQRITTYAPLPSQDPEFFRQWHLHTNFNHHEFDPRSSTACDEAWSLLDSLGSRDVVVAVTDDGCKLDHADFDSGNKFANWGYMRGIDLISSTDFAADPAQMYIPGANHGTSCCGVIAAEADSSLCVGAAPGSKLLPIQWQSSGPSLFISDSKLLRVLNFIEDKVDVMSNSWGGVPFSLWSLPVIRKITELSESGGRRGKGIVFLWAAGNENCPINHTTNQDVPYTSGWQQQVGGSWVWGGVETSRVFENNLSGIPGVMHVAALASTVKRSHYSNYGSGISICAPSNNVHAYSRMILPGLGITTASGSGITHNFGGTSSATPLVAGIAALVVSANQNLTALEVISVLQQTAFKDLDLTAYDKTPAASYDPDPSWDISPVAPFDSGNFVNDNNPDGSWSPWFGYGRVDAKAAVAKAISLLGDENNGSERFSASSAPDRSIPDNSFRGIKDKIICNQSFAIESIAVTVDISHTYIGDLVVTLISPTGHQVNLHNRAGSSNNDIHATYDISSTPELNILREKGSTGEWVLHVQDMANVDRGRLLKWSLNLQGEVRQFTQLEDSPGAIIPDNNIFGIERILHNNKDANVGSIEVTLDISHSYIGDLVVELTAPGAITVVLHNRVGESSDNIIKTYTLANTPALQAFVGKSAKGDWMLKVSDHAGLDQGKLNKWALKLT